MNRLQILLLLCSTAACCASPKVVWIIDSVAPGNLSSEKDHGLAGEQSSTVNFRRLGFKQAEQGGWFAYTLGVKPNLPNVLNIQYWGGETKRSLDIHVEGEKIASQRLHNNKPGEFFTAEYPIPQNVTAGKQKVTVRFDSDESKVGGVFNIQMLSTEPMEKPSEPWCFQPWGDQGDGTFRNPVLVSNYPDNDVLRVGDTFYMMSSTCHYVPGMVILKSKDLVNWEFSNHVMPGPIEINGKYNYDQLNQYSLGIWAGSFGYNGEHYLAYWCVGDSRKFYVSKAKAITGPWTKPVELKYADGESIHGTDPGVFWDHETKEAWMSMHCKIYKMSWDGMRILENKGGGIAVAQRSGLWGEATKLYKFGDWYYMGNATVRHNPLHGGPNRMEAIHRARSMEGPWEGRLVLEDGNGTDRSPSQGTLLQLDDGSCWFIHQLAWGHPLERYQGRPQLLQPVTWKDGWPLIGTDTDADGIGEVIWEPILKPIPGHPITAPATSDDFESSTLGMQWQWRHNPIPDRWSVKERPGFLRLKSCVPIERSRQNSRFFRLPNVISQRLMGLTGNVMVAKCELGGMEPGQEAGMHISSMTWHSVGVIKLPDGRFQTIFRTDEPQQFIDGVKTADGFSIADQKLSHDQIWFKAEVDNGMATFAYSTNGYQFTSIGVPVQLRFSGFTASGVGFYSINDREAGCLDVDWFTYDYDGPGAKSIKSN